MQLAIRAHHVPLTKALKDYIKRRLQFALGSRFDQIQRIRVSLSDINGPRGGEDMRCQIQIKLPGQSEVVVEDVQAQLIPAVNSAASRASLTVTRRLERLCNKAKRLNPITHRKRLDPELNDTLEGELK